MTGHKCEACGAEGATMHCGKCGMVFYCSRECQKRNWKRLHKHVCTTDPSLRRFVPVEMAIERVLAKQLKVQAPKDATCYICLEGEDGGKLMRGCACRGDSAGFVHLKCLTELAMSRDASGVIDAIQHSWIKCINCKQEFTGALGLEMQRRFWRHHRSTQHQAERQYRGLHYNSAISLFLCLRSSGEFDAAKELLDEVSTCFRDNSEGLLDVKLHRVDLLQETGQELEALGLLQAMLPEAKQYPSVCCRTMYITADVLLCLHRYQEVHDIATELVAFAKEKFGPEDNRTLGAVKLYAVACAKLGRVDEAKANFNDVLTTQTRVLGREHPYTHSIRQCMKNVGFA